MEQITAKITLTKAEWSLLSLCFTHSTYMLPKSCWEVTDTIAKEIENGLCTAFYEEECVQRVLKKEEN